MATMKRAFSTFDFLIIVGFVAICVALVLPAIFHKNHNVQTLTYPVNETTGQTTGWSYSIYLIDGCQYVRWNDTLTHKGNCTNSIHTHNQ